ncbi:MMPL family transporter [Nocardioides limicola]|uniref:MMPL family transporter n=1 Tax=Nocardioides limicola TaxID=2803368 RepID=UPI00193C6D07|nr:MMPL family transporter [Nocardioides sp. DJM-14]
MARLLYRLGRTAYLRWPLVLVGWLIVAISVGAVAATFSKPMSDSFSIPGIPSERAGELQEELFGQVPDAFDHAGVTVVVAAPEGEKLSAYEDEIARLIDDLGQVPQMPAETGLVDPVLAAAGLTAQLLEAAEEAGTPTDVAEANAAALSPLSEDGRVGLLSFTFDVASVMEVDSETRAALIDVLDETADRTGLAVAANGNGMASMEDIGLTAELIGIAVALGVLVLTFGSLVAAGMPILTAVFGVGLGLAGITAMTALMDIGSTTPMLATMLGLAVGIDYALFILARYRAELPHHDDRAEAVGVAVGTAGSAVVFAGLTVLIALAALSVVRIPFLTAMGLAAAATVLVAVLVALTLIPAVLGMTKSKAFGGVVRRYRPRIEHGRVLNNGVRWARFVGRAPVAVLLIATFALVALAVPLKGLHLAFPTDATAPVETTQRQASDLVADAFGPGREAPMLLVVDAGDVADESRPEAYGEVIAWAADRDNVSNVQIVAMNEDGSGAQILLTPSTGPDQVATEDLLASLRGGQAGIETDTGTEVGVTGLTAITVDVSERLADALPVYLAVVIGLAFVLLMIVFRSILVPLTATLGFLLSVLATLGATVAVFSNGAFGLMEGQPIVSFMPIFLIGVVFGLAMDYQVFLVSRIREAYVHGMTPREAVVDGFRNSARVVTAAAVIMASVFAAFMLIDEPVVRSMGFALAAAIIFDAFVVRMALIPAVMYLLGERAWWLPAWLDRLLPNVDIEGASLERPAPVAAETREPVLV